MKSRWRVPRKPCPVNGCVEPVKLRFIMCPACWRTVEVKIRRANQRAYRAWLADKRDRDLRLTLIAANGACIASANAARAR